MVALVPNLNWAGDTSLPRYFQIRGIGELQQYQGAPNPSVGFLIDDVDFSGLGGIATLFDVDHIEVLHGPQATLYGANALAGMIYVRSAEPEDTFGGRAEFGAGNYATQSYGAVLTGPVESLDSSLRLAAERYFSNGYYHNAYVQAPTDQRDDMTARARWRYRPSDQLQVDFSLLHVSIDNGYDQWTINNSRTTESNDPGVDDQNSTGASMRAVYDGLKGLRLTAIATYADSRINYGYDGDWGNPLLWAPYTYEYTEEQVRERSTRSLELRLGTTAERGFGWLFGVYAFGLRESLRDTSAGIYVDPFDSTQNSNSLTVLNSTYSSTNAALYGQLDGDLGARGRWSLGLRGERHTTDYNDTTTNLDAPTTANSFNPSENLWGGHASIDWRIADGQQLYALLARGYKAGGFNLSPGLPPDEVYFGPESDLNFEIGHKARLAGGALELQSSLFYIYRRSPQLLTGTQFDPDNPDTFVFYTGNAASGYNYGLESSLAWRAAPDCRSTPRSGCCRRNTGDSCKAAWCSPIASCRTRPIGRRRSPAPGATRAAPICAWTSPAWAPSITTCRRIPPARGPMDSSMPSWGGSRRAMRSIGTGATCSTRITRCAASISATCRRIFRTRPSCSTATPSTGVCT